MENDTDQERDRPSKTQRKKEMTGLQDLGIKLVALNAQQLAAVPMPEFLRDAVLDARRIKGHEALRRQMQFIGRLMRETDAAPIRAKIDEWEGQSAEHVAREHAINRWRDRLLEDDSALTEFAAAHRGLDIQQLRLLVRNARAERVAGKPPKHFRELFRFIRDTVIGGASEGLGLET